MLWSLLKILFFVAVIILITIGATLLQDADGHILISALGVEFSLGPLQAAIGLVVLLVVLWVLLKIVGFLMALMRFINGDETAMSRYFDRNRERKGFSALSDAMMALANGDASEALSKAKKADGLLNKPHLTNLVVAQAAELKGDTKTASETYKKLLADPKTKFVGVRGLLQQKITEGDTETATALAEKAVALNPQHANTQDALLALQTESENWSGARKTLDTKLKHGTVPRDLHRRRDGVMAFAEAETKHFDGDLEAAQILAIEANRLSPGLVPAAVMVARGYMDQSKPKLASRVLASAWEQSPHPDLAAQFAALQPDEDPKARAKRFVNLIKGAPNHPESHMTMAELALADGDFGKAENEVKDLVAEDPTQRSVTIMAAVARGKGKPDEEVQKYLTKALTSPRDPEWICDSCGDAHRVWDVTCPTCSAFDAISWKRPPMTVQDLDPRILPLLTAPEPIKDLGEGAEILLPEPTEKP